MILFINTCIEKKIILAIKDTGKILSKEYEIKNRQAENMVASLDDFFVFFKKKIDDLKGVIVANGNGKFTSLRVGISTANAISYALNIPIADVRFELKFSCINLEEVFLIYEKKKDKKLKYGYINPFYNKEPNITCSKKQ